MELLINLNQTILEDVEAVEAAKAELERVTKIAEKRLHNAKSILRTHEAAKSRLLGTVAQSIAVSKGLPVITKDNWEDLKIKVGDKVEVVETSDSCFKANTTYRVYDVERPRYQGRDFLMLENIDTGATDWLVLNSHDQILLIRTEEGSL